MMSESVFKYAFKQRYTFILFVGLVCIQILLGILTLVQSIGIIPVGLGVMHQGVGVLVIGSFLAHYYFLKQAKFS
jgi:heme A synthase